MTFGRRSGQSFMVGGTRCDSDTRLKISDCLFVKPERTQENMPHDQLRSFTVTLKNTFYHGSENKRPRVPVLSKVSLGVYSGSDFCMSEENFNLSSLPGLT